MVIIILLVAIIAFFYLMGINLLFPIPETAYYYIFSSIVQSEAAIFGILFIILTFSLQYVSNKYQINTLKIIENSREIKSFTGIVIFSMITNLIALSLIKANWTIFSIVASLGIGSAFYFILSLYGTLKYTIKLSSLPNITTILISNTPKSEGEFFKWIAVLKDSVRPVLKSSDSVESKLIYLRKVLPTIKNQVNQMINYFPQNKKSKYIAKIFLAIIEPAIEVQKIRIIQTIVPESFKYLKEISPEALKIVFKDFIVICNKNNFSEGLKFILHESFQKRGTDNNNLVSYYEDFFISIQDVTNNLLRNIENNPFYTEGLSFLDTTSDFLLNSLESHIPVEQKRVFFVSSVRMFLLLIESLRNLSEIMLTKHNLHNPDTITQISLCADKYGESLEKFAETRKEIVCSKEVVELLRRESPKFLDLEGGLDKFTFEFTSAREYLKKLVDTIYKNCK